MFCTCPDFELRQQACKHVYAVQYVLFRETTTNGDSTTVKETAAVRVTYAQNWPAYNAAQVAEKETFLNLLRDLCADIEEPMQSRGRPRLPLRDMIFAAAFKVYSTASARRFMTDLRDAQAKGLITQAPHYNSLFRCLESETVTPIIRDLVLRAAIPLRSVETDFAIDSTGFSSTQLVGQWQEAKYGATKSGRAPRDWVKVHAVCGVKTNVITAIEVTERNTQDAPYFAPLVTKTIDNFNVLRVMGDKAYSSYANLELAVSKGAEPFIPFKSYAKATSPSQTWNKLFAYFILHRDEFLNAYHKRSNVESTFSAIKRGFGDSVRSRTRAAQVNEVLLKVLAHNIRCLIHTMAELGITPSFWGNGEILGAS
jgi:transposase